MDTAVEVLSHILTSSVWLDLISKNMLCHNLDKNEISLYNL